MKDIDICYGLDAAHCGLTDFYKESEQKLRAALDSGEDFDTGWWGSKKGTCSARICREDGKVTVEVSCYMDDLYESDDLIYDALWEEFQSEEELPDDIIESIRDAAIDMSLDDNSSVCDTLSQDASFEDICECLGRLADEADKDTSTMYNELRSIVKAHVEFMRSQGSKEQA